MCALAICIAGGAYIRVVKIFNFLGYASNVFNVFAQSALGAAREYEAVIIDVASFRNTLSDAQSGFEQARSTTLQTNQQLRDAQSALQNWEDTSVEDDLVRLDERISKEGGLNLTTDNKDYYLPSNMMTGAWRWVFDGDSYRDVRAALSEYGHGENGKDAFADLANFKEKYADYRSAIAQASEAHATAQDTEQSAKGRFERLSKLSEEIKPDQEILVLVHGDVAGDLKSSNAFCVALADHYEEDFPRNLPLIMVKMDTLSRMETGAHKKLESIKANLRQVQEQYEKLAKLPQNSTIKVDLDAIKKRNQARHKENQGYVDATSHGWRDTVDYMPLAILDISSEVLTQVMWYNLLSGSSTSFDSLPEGDQFVAATDSAFTADLLGLNSENAAELGMPEAALEADPEFAQSMAELGVEDYGVGNMGADILSDLPAGEDFSSLADVDLSGLAEGASSVAEGAAEAAGSILEGLGDILGGLDL